MLRFHLLNREQLSSIFFTDEEEEKEKVQEKLEKSSCRAFIFIVGQYWSKSWWTDSRSYIVLTCFILKTPITTSNVPTEPYIRALKFITWTIADRPVVGEKLDKVLISLITSTVKNSHCDGLTGQRPHFTKSTGSSQDVSSWTSGWPENQSKIIWQT